MNALPLCDRIRAELGELFVCAEQGSYHRIRTPYLYPDGDNIDLFFRAEGDATIITDLGETTRWLRMQTASLRRTPRQGQLIDDICLTHGVRFNRGMLETSCSGENGVAGAVTRLAQAALRVSDLWFTFRTRAIQSTPEEVADYLTERDIAFAPGETFSGRSGRSWSVDLHVRKPARESLVYVLSSGNRSAARKVTEHVLAAWYDLSHLTHDADAVQLVSLFDDTSDVWRDEDFRLLEGLSSVARWSRPDEFSAMLLDSAA